MQIDHQVIGGFRVFRPFAQAIIKLGHFGQQTRGQIPRHDHHRFGVGMAKNDVEYPGHRHRCRKAECEKRYAVRKPEIKQQSEHAQIGQQEGLQDERIAPCAGKQAKVAIVQQAKRGGAKREEYRIDDPRAVDLRVKRKAKTQL